MARPKPEVENVVLSVQVPKPLKTALEKMAFDNRVTFPELMRKLLGAAVRRHEKKVGKQTT